MQVTITVGRHKHPVVVPADATWADLAAALLAALAAPAAARPADVKLLWRGRAVTDPAAGVTAAGVTDGSRLVALVPRACLPAAPSGGGGRGVVGGPASMPAAVGAASATGVAGVSGPPVMLGDPLPTDGSPYVVVLHGGARYCVLLPVMSAATGVADGGGAPHSPHPHAVLTERLAALTGLPPHHQALIYRGAPLTPALDPAALSLGAKVLLLRSAAGADAAEAATDMAAVAADVADTTSRLRGVLASVRGGGGGAAAAEVTGAVLLTRAEELVRVVADRQQNGGRAGTEGVGPGWGNLAAAAEAMEGLMLQVREAFRREH
ncbi:hypothetical protein MMPV_001917 [Pyropia vietnamensis]